MDDYSMYDVPETLTPDETYTGLQLHNFLRENDDAVIVLTGKELYASIGSFMPNKDTKCYRCMACYEGDVRYSSTRSASPPPGTKKVYIIE